MQDGGLSPKTIGTYVNIVKTVVASVINEETGEPVFMRKWNATALDLPVVENQKQPCLTAKEIEAMTADSETWERMLYVILASSGLRISEALALNHFSISNNWSTLGVTGQVSRFGDVVQYTKTRAGLRQVDLHSSVAEMLKNGRLEAD
jgi:integrase